MGARSARTGDGGISHRDRTVNSAMEGPGVEVLMQALTMIPPHVAHEATGFSVQCSVPQHFVGGLIGRNGSVVKEVRDTTVAKIDFAQSSADSNCRTLNISGPLFGCVAAYLHSMKNYARVEASNASYRSASMRPVSVALPGRDA